jgi:hypothetical protein
VGDPGSRMNKIKADKRRLNICPLEIYDGTLGELPQIGVKSSYSDTLLKNIKASVISDRNRWTISGRRT